MIDSSKISDKDREIINLLFQNLVAQNRLKRELRDLEQIYDSLYNEQVLNSKIKDMDWNDLCQIFKETNN